MEMLKAATDNITNGNTMANSYDCAGDYTIPLFPVWKTCRSTQVTVPYNSQVIKDTAADVGIRTFLSGITAYRPGTDNIGFGISGESTSSTYFKYNAIAHGTPFSYSETTLIYMMNLYYVVFERTTIKTDYSILLDNNVKTDNNCWYVNKSPCASPPYKLTVSNAGPQYTPYVFLIGFNRLYTTADVGQTGNFRMTSVGVNGNNVETKWSYTGNTNHNFQLSASYLVYQLITCSGNALDIYLTIDRQNCNATCNANIGQYPDGSNTCQYCTGNCYSCQTTSTQCTACISGSNRILNGTTCICNPNGFYEDVINVNCVACSYTCITCSYWTNASCTSCNLTVHHRFIQGNACPCIDGYYDSGDAVCDACDQSCLTCSGAGPNACLSCDSSLNRFLTGSSCLCNQFFFENGTASCPPCHYSCVTCTNNTYLTCKTCNSSAFRFLSTNSCACKQGYYDVGPQVMLCAPCDPTCLICNGPLNTNCYMFCDATKFRNLVGSQCLCVTSYYEMASFCYPCDVTCENCTGGTDQQCSTCLAGSFRTFAATSCLCNPGYYQARQTNCLACSSACQTCNVTFSQCTSCNITNHRTVLIGSTCPCDAGYYDSGSAMCQTCHYSCLTCWTAGVTGCLTCNTLIRLLSFGECLCLGGTYDNGATSTCSPCDVTCLTCSAGTSLSCTSCNGTLQRTLSSHSCPCNTGYYDAGILQCIACSSTCATCSQSTNNCTSCSSANFRTIVGNTCVCQAHYYQTGAVACATCLATCLNCTAFSTCTACDGTTSFRTLSSESCICKPGYFDTGSTVCATCSYKCLTCNSSSTNCLSCNSSALRVQGPATCDCLSGYYDNGVTACAICHYSCNACTGGLSTNCFSCNATAFRDLAGTQCICSAGYYDNGSLEQCLVCSYTCLTCLGSSTFCNGCDASLSRTLSSGQCTCQQGYYEAGLPSCTACSLTCLSCAGPLPQDCLTCNSANHRTLNGSYYCECQLGYFETGAASCSACSITCLACQTAATTCTSCPSSTFRQLQSSFCFCQDGYFDDGSVICSLCDPKCATCVMSSTNCMSCNASQLTILSGNLCVCILGAFAEPVHGMCIACHYSCTSCSSAGNTSCLTCTSANNRRQVGTACICNDGFFEQGTSVCSTCNSNCLTCFGGNSSFNCTSCQPGFTLFTSTCLPILNCPNYYFEGQCVNSCPNYTYPLGNACLKCINNCYTCLNATACTSCINKTYLSPALSCSSACSSNQYLNVSSCVNCPANCVTCAIDNTGVATCTSCLSTQFYYKGSCVSSCPPAITVLQNGTCLECAIPCLTCSSLSSESCLTCRSNYYLLGSNCLPQCPNGMYGSLLTQNCENCPLNCTQCQPNPSNSSSSVCTACVSPLYLSFGVCVDIGTFNNNGATGVCHPNCLTCTNISFSSCIRCKELRGDSSGMATKGYCDCTQGTIDIGEGACDKSLFSSIQSANSILATGSVSLAVTSITLGALTANPTLILKFICYNQMIGQMSYFNSSTPAAVDSLYNSSAKYNFGRLLEGFSPQKMARRLLYDNSTQSLESLFLHGGGESSMMLFTLVVIGINLLLWIMLGVFHKLVPLLKQQYKSEQRRSTKVLYKLSTHGIRVLKFGALIYLMQFTLLEACFNIFVSARIAYYSNIRIETLVSSCVLFVYYLAFSLFLTVKAIKVGPSTEKYNKKESYSSLFLNFDQECNKWYHRAFFSVTLLKVLLLQLWLVTLSFSPFAQSLAWVITQLLYTLYLIASNPFESPYSKLMVANELVLIVQFTTFCIMSVQPEGGRLPYSLALIAIGYIQIGIFALYTLLFLVRTIISICQRQKNLSKSTTAQVHDEGCVQREDATKENIDLSEKDAEEMKSGQQISNAPPIKAFTKTIQQIEETQEDLFNIPIIEEHSYEDRLFEDLAIIQLARPKFRKRYRVEKRKDDQEQSPPANN